MTLIEKIQLDDAMSNLIDDKVEGAFMIHLYGKIAKKDPNEVIPDDYVKSEIKSSTPSIPTLKRINVSTTPVFSMTLFTLISLANISVYSDILIARCL